MQNYCDNCNVKIDELISNCPLCGKCVSKKEKTNISTETSTYPSYSKLYYYKNYVLKIITIFLILASLSFVALEFFLTNKIHLSYYVFASFILIYFGIIIPLKHNFSLSTSSILALVFVIAFIVFVEWYSKTFGWAIQYVIPFILVGYSIYNGILIIAKGYFNFEYFIPVLVAGFFSTILIVLTYLKNWILWPSLTAFILSWVITFLVASIKYTKLKKSIQKKFHF